MKRNAENQHINSNKNRNLDEVSTELFGKMRDATEEERKSVDAYIRSVSKPTGINFFDLYDMEVKKDGERL